MQLKDLQNSICVTNLYQIRSLKYTEIINIIHQSIYSILYAEMKINVRYLFTVVGREIKLYILVSSLRVLRRAVGGYVMLNIL